MSIIPGNPKANCINKSLVIICLSSTPAWASGNISIGTKEEPKKGAYCVLQDAVGTLFY